ncbi:TPM domain-containing protein [Xylanimonas oleitrophica]|uniref:TPM domain-containing protein n=1 Tax=Xylanimonas oleitrophica TaxID=2607479 RepID=A0A2W5WUT2_9MICO|nr:TPM domain-containing protein [Xylanimonas oleitrophica]
MPGGAAAGLLSVARAEPPLTTLDGAITDRAGVLGDDEAQVRAALDRLADETRYQLFVVYVDDFENMDGESWANATANNARLGAQDLLLAVAPAERLFGLSYVSGGDLSERDVDVIQDAVADRLRAVGDAPADDADWGSAAVVAADATRAALASSSGPEVSPLALSGGAVVVAGGVGGWLWWRRRRQERGVPASSADELAGLPTQDLDRRASSALVAIDDALRTSEQELGFAQAEFGLEATTAFERALAQAREDVRQAFALRQHLDDSTQEAEPQRRELLTRIVTLCDGAADALDEQTAAFDDLRKIAERAPQVLDETLQRADEIAARIDVSRQALATLSSTYPASALASVSANPDQAASLVDGARSAVEQGRAALAKRDRGTAVAHARGAQNALGQAVTLLDAVDRAGQDLAEAGPRLERGIASITQDIADAARLAPLVSAAGDASVAPAEAEARAAVEEARAARDGGDPLAALARLTAAEAALDKALEPARAKAEADARATALLRDTVGRVESQVRATEDFVATRRRAVGPEARTRLAEATRLLGEARSLHPADPPAALARAQQAERYAQAAARAAQQDVAGWGQQQGGGDVGGMVLGGILLDSILRSGGGRGGFGGSTYGRSGRSSGRPGGRVGGGFGGAGFGGGRPAGRGGGGGRSARGGRF